MKLTAKQKDEETTTVYSKDIISVVKLPEEFTAALLFWNDVLYTTEATGGLSNIVRPNGWQTYPPSASGYRHRGQMSRHHQFTAITVRYLYPVTCCHIKEYVGYLKYFST